MSVARRTAVWDVWRTMRCGAKAGLKAIAVGLLVAALMVTASCGSGGSSTPTSTLSIAANPGVVAGGGTFLFSSTATNLTSSSAGVTFTLALNVASNGETTTPCTASCGALSDESTSVTSTSTVDGTIYYNVTTTALYTAPLEPPSPNNLILTATAPSSASVTATVVFTIGAPGIVTKITNKITKILPGAAPVTLHATADFDPKKKGVTWNLTAGGFGCAPLCGKMSDKTTSSAVYTPPATLPKAPNDTPTITATSISNTSNSDFDTFTIEGSTLPISVSIVNPFTSIDAGASGVTVRASVTNDTRSQGVTWTISPGAGAGVLSAATATSILYTPPNLAPQPPNNVPVITATSVADPTKTASFQFTINPAAGSHTACTMDGQWAFVLRSGAATAAMSSGGDADQAVHPLVMAGSMAVDGSRVSIRSVDVNDDFRVQPSDGALISGSCQVEMRQSAGGEAHRSYVIRSDSDVPGLATGSELVLDSVAQADGSLSLGGTSVSGAELSGVAARQDLAVFAGFGGDLALNLVDLGSGGRGETSGNVALEFSALAGRVRSGSISEWAQSGEQVFADAAVKGAASAPDANGRGTLRLELTGSAGSATSAGTSATDASNVGAARNFVYYVVSRTKIVLLEMDSGKSFGYAKVMEAGTATPRVE